MSLLILAQLLHSQPEQVQQLCSLLVSPLSWLQAVALRVLGWVAEATPLQTPAVAEADAASGSEPAEVIRGLRWGESEYVVCYKSSVSVSERADIGYRRDHHTLSPPAHLYHLADVEPVVVCRQPTAKCAGGTTLYVAAAAANGWARKQQRTGEIRANTRFRGISYTVVSFRLKNLSYYTCRLCADFGITAAAMSHLTTPTGPLTNAASSEYI